jgi:hypothetical protein
MSHRFKLSRLLAVTVGLAITAPVAVLIGPADAATVTTAWQNGSFSANPSGVVSESDIVLGAANTADSQSMPLGNGSLGVAAWAATTPRPATRGRRSVRWPRSPRAGRT